MEVFASLDRPWWRRYTGALSRMDEKDVMNPDLGGPAADARSALPDNDYVSPGLAVIMPDAAFPNMIVGDTRVPRWPWLRRWVEQNWYTDRRNADAGFASRDEAAILYNSALLCRGKPCLEVGSWRGWSTVHLALGAGDLDTIDPVFGDPGFLESIRDSCEAAGVLDRVRFHEGFSPAAIDTLSQATKTRWSLIFIDAEHEGDAPRRDAEAAIRNAADTALVLFHDLTSPFVAAGLDAMRDAGWRTMVYQTMQIMGVAWRGDIEPVAHTPDPRVFWTLPKHLSGYDVSGWKRPLLPRSDGGWWPDMTSEDRVQAAAMRAQIAEDDQTGMLLDHAASSARMAAEFGRLHALATTESARAAAAAEASVAAAAAYEARLVPLAERVGAAEFERDQLLRRAHAAERSVGELAASHRRHDVVLQSLEARRRNTLAAALGHDGENAAMLEMARWAARKRVLFGLLRRPGTQRIAILERQGATLGLSAPLVQGLLPWLARRRVLLGLLRRSTASAEALVGVQLLQVAMAGRSQDLRQRLTIEEKDA